MSFSRWLSALPAAGLIVALALPAFAQDESSPARPKKYRQLVPGVFRTVPSAPSLRVGEVPSQDEYEQLLKEGLTYTRADVVELKGDPRLQWDPQFTPKTRVLKSMIQDQVYRRDIWSLEFSFKPIRYVEALVPTADGRVERKLVWYMVYKVRNPGGHLHVTYDDEGRPELERVDKPVRFIPRFWLERHPDDLESGDPIMLPDRLLPVVIPQIQRREDPNRELLDTASIAEQLIPVSTETEDNSVWGVVTWVSGEGEDEIDPATDRFSIFLQGLTNAYIWRDQPVEAADDEPSFRRRFAYKTLELKFWRPGDEFEPEEGELLFGFPREEAPYRWFYREVD